jgi:hypothetical protein
VRTEVAGGWMRPSDRFEALSAFSGSGTGHNNSRCCVMSLFTWRVVIAASGVPQLVVRVTNAAPAMFVLILRAGTARAAGLSVWSPSKRQAVVRGVADHRICQRSDSSARKPSKRSTDSLKKQPRARILKLLVTGCPQR